MIILAIKIPEGISFRNLFIDIMINTSPVKGLAYYELNK